MYVTQVIISGMRSQCNLMNNYREKLCTSLMRYVKIAWGGDFKSDVAIFEKFNFRFFKNWKLKKLNIQNIFHFLKIKFLTTHLKILIIFLKVLRTPKKVMKLSSFISLSNERRIKRRKLSSISEKLSGSFNLVLCTSIIAALLRKVNVKK